MAEVFPFYLLDTGPGVHVWFPHTSWSFGPGDSIKPCTREGSDPLVARMSLHSTWPGYTVVLGNWPRGSPCPVTAGHTVNGSL